MAPIYRNTTPSARVADHPRAVYRVVIERRGLYALDYLTRFVTWPGVVLSVVENSATVAGFPISSPEKSVAPTDTVATLDYRAGSHPGAATVSDIVTAVDGASKYVTVKSIERMPPVPAESQGGAAALDASRDAAQQTERDEAERESFLAKLADQVKSGAKAVLVVAAIAGVVALVILWPRKSS
jgi:hypothetical protein